MNAKAENRHAADPVPATGLARLSALAGPDPHVEAAMLRKHYKAEPLDLQGEVVKLQRHFIAHGDRILARLEGRDSSRKDGSIKRIVAHLSPHDTRVVALGKPSDNDLRSWYFERYVGQVCEFVSGTIRVFKLGDEPTVPIPDGAP